MTRSSQIPIKTTLPRELVECEAWVVWRYLESEAKGKPRKVPFYVDGAPRGQGTTLDSQSDVARLSSFDQAAQTARTGNFSGIGFALRVELGIGALDLDGCVDGNGQINDDIAHQVYDAAKSAGCYCETSPSGKGLRIIGATHGLTNFNRGGYEAYGSKRFVTITGACRENPAGWGSIDEAVKLLDRLAPAANRAPQTLLSTVPASLGTNIPEHQYIAPLQVLEGGRNDALLRHAGHLRGNRMPEQLIREALLDFNRARCLPPLDEGEVREIADRYQKLAVSNVAADWPEPKKILPGLPPVQKFDPEMLPDAFRSYVIDQSELMQVPPDLIAVPLMISASAVLGNSWAIAPKALDESWLEVPILWGGLVGRPGVKKTAAMKRGIVFLDEVEANMRADYQSKLQQYQADKLRFDVSVSKFKASQKNGGDVELPPTEPNRPEPERLILNDTTVQKVGDLLQWSPRGLLLIKDELVGHLESLRTQGQEGARAFYLESWNGTNSYSIDRVGRGSLFIKRLAVWFLGGIQPSKLHTYVREATGGGGGDDGLLQRFQLLVWPDLDESWKIIDRPQSQDAINAARHAIIRLRSLDPVAVGAKFISADQPAFLHFSDDAQLAFNDLWTAIEKKVRRGKDHPALESHFGKYGSLFAKLALVIHLVDGGVGPVDRQSSIKAGRWINYLKSHAQRVYASAANSAAMAAFALSQKIVTGELASGFSARELERKGWSKLTSGADAKGAIEWLIDANWLRELEEQTGGRARVSYTVNPRIVLNVKR